MKRIAGGLWALLRAITEILEELAPLAKHNAEIYQQATEALRQLSAKEAKIGKQQAELEKARTETTSLQEKVAAEVADARAKLTQDQQAFETESRTWNETAKGRDRELDERKVALDGREAQVATAADQAQALKTVADEALARVVAREKELTTKIRGLRESLA